MIDHFKAGTLITKYVELPFETEEEKAKADKMNAEIAHLGFRTLRSANDWFYVPADSKEPTALKKGDLVKVFKTISEGNVLCDLVIDFDRSEYHHGFQRGIDRGEWSRMFRDELPAKLIRDGKVVHGALMPFCETGTEGVIWSVQEYGGLGYGGLNCLQDGDQLIVFNAVYSGEIEWEGEMDFGPTDVKKIDWSEVMRDTLHMPTKQWMSMSYDRRPILIKPAFEG